MTGAPRFAPSPRPGGFDASGHLSSNEALPEPDGANYPTTLGSVIIFKHLAVKS